MRNIIIILVAFCMWATTFYRLKIWKRASQQEPALTAKFKYAFILHFFLASAVTLFYEAVGLWLNNRIGLANFSWLAAYLCGITAFYAYNLFAYNPIYLPIKTKSRILALHKKIWLASSVALTLIYWFTIRLSPQWPSRLPRSLSDVVFQNLFFSVLIIQCLTVVWAIYLSIKEETHNFFKLQLCLSLVTSAAGILCFILKIIFVSLWLSFPNSPQLILLNQLALLAMALAGLLSLSNLIIIPIITPLSHLIKAFSSLSAWLDLLDLQDKLYKHQLISQPTSSSLSQYLAEPNYHIMKIIVSILDAQRSVRQLAQDKDSSKRKLQSEINNLNPDLKYEELITACRKINQLIK